MAVERLVRSINRDCDQRELARRAQRMPETGDPPKKKQEENESKQASKQTNKQTKKELSRYAKHGQNSRDE